MEKLLRDIFSHKDLKHTNVLERKTLKSIWANFRKRNSSFCIPFHEVVTNLEDNKVITDITFDEVYFNVNIMEGYKTSGHSPVVGSNLEYLTEVLKHHKTVLQCLICNEILSTRGKLTKHNQSIGHILRADYHLKKTSDWFSKQPVLSLSLFDINKKAYVTEVNVKTKKNINIRAVLINTSNKVLQINTLIKLNRHMNELKIEMEIPNRETIIGKHLGPGRQGTFNVVGKFNNSTSFKFPFCVTVTADGVTEHILMGFNVNIGSDWAYLDSGDRFVPKDKKKVTLHITKVVPGVAPASSSRNSYKEITPLLKHTIPKSFELFLIGHIKQYPDFAKRSINIDFNFKESAKAFSLPTKLRQTNYLHLLMHLLHVEEYQQQIDIRDYDTVSTVQHLGHNSYRLKVPGLAEARPSLVHYDSVFLIEKETDTVKYEGLVHHILEKEVDLGLNYKFSTVFKPNKPFIVQFSFNRRAIKVQKQAVTLARRDNMVPYLFPKTGQVSIIQENTTTSFETTLNAEQKRAIQNLLTRKSAPYLIFGPPGTGKTVTVVEAILQIYKTQPATRILVCAPSNEAVNEIAMRLLGKIPPSELIRLVGPMYGKGAMKSELKSIINLDKEGKHYMPDKKQLMKYRVVISTLVTAARLINGGIPEEHFSYVFIDESGYATESQSLIPLAGILSANKKIFGQLVLAGDPRQLGPILHSNFVKYCGFHISMLERLIDTCEIYARDETKEVPYDERYVTKLLRNYRSHPAILHVSNDIFYHRELLPVGTKFTHTFVGWEGLKNAKFPVIFHNVQGEDVREKNSPSFFNTQEIEEVVQYLEKLVGSVVNGLQIEEEHIGIITPYRKQADKLNQVCQKLKMPKVTVGTVEQFQGNEKLVVIISTVRSKNTNKFEELDKKCQLGFLRNPKRFNVALTRAKALMIVVGNAEVLNCDKYWRTFIKYCKDNNSVVGQPFTPPPIDPPEEIINQMASMDLDDGAAGDV